MILIIKTAKNLYNINDLTEIEDPVKCYNKKPFADAAKDSRRHSFSIFHCNIRSIESSFENVEHLI